MFINCPYCRALVATDPATDLPPTHCPHCTSLLRRDASVVDDMIEIEEAPTDLGDLLDAHSAGTSVAIPDAQPASAARPVDPAVHLIAGTDERPPSSADTTSHTSDHTVVDAAADAHRPLTQAAVPATDVQVTNQRRAGHAPSFVRGTTAARTAQRERWIPAAAIALSLTFVLQLLLADRARLASDATWRPLLTTVCKVFFCDLPPWREPGAFTLLQRDVRQHPSIPGALRVSATFRNDARWPQPWPQLQVTLSDANGRRAGERRFNAEDYLGGPPNQAELSSGESATIAMDLHEPAARIVAYDFRFR